MIALVLSSRPLQAPQYLPETISFQNQAPEKVDPMNVTSYEQLVQKLKGYEPKMILVLSSDLTESAYKWIPEVMSYLTKGDQTLFILPKSEMDYYHLQIVIGELVKELQWTGQIRLLGANLTFQEVADQLSGKERDQKKGESVPNAPDEMDELSILLGATQRDEGRKGHVVTLTGPGSSGQTTLALYHVPYLAELNPDKEFLMVDINDDKKDLVAATDSQNYRLHYFKPAFQKKSLEEIEMKYHVPYKKLPNLKVISAVQDQHQWSPNEIVMFLEKVRNEFDMIFFDMGELVLTQNAKIRLMMESNEVIVIVRPDSFSLNRTLRYMNVLEKLKSKVLISHYDANYASKSEIEKYLGLPIFGVMPYERGIIPKQTTTDLLQPSKQMQKAFAEYKWEIDVKVSQKKKKLWIASF